MGNQFKWIEVFLLLFGFSLILLLQTVPTFEAPTFVPNAISGLTTISGILAAFVGFWLTHTYSHADKESKKWMSRRMKVVVLSIGFALGSVIMGQTQLVTGSLRFAYLVTLYGTSIIVLTLLWVLFMIFFRDEIQKLENKSTKNK